ncbi:MAG: ABC transporter permease [Dehalococcoidales bacterium]|nr:ABC transporter permease [Dehalococcoidales bacterium]
MSEVVLQLQAPVKRRSLVVDIFIRMVKEKPLGTVGLVIFVLLLFTGIFADFIAPYGMNEGSVDFIQPPSARYWLGTDNLGRDLLSRVIYGARISMIVGLTGASLSLTISIMIGMLAGFIGGRFDMVVQRFVDAWMCFPGLVILIAILSLTGPGMLQVIVVLSLGYGISGSRVVRSAVMGVKENIYVDAAKAIGAPTGWLLIRHILPNIMAPLIVLFTVRMPFIILDEASLSFLGFGIPPPTPSWGGMLSGAGRSYMFLAPWLAIWPGLALTIVVYGINMFGDALRDLLDPRLRGGLGRYGGGAMARKVKKMKSEAGV